MERMSREEGVLVSHVRFYRAEKEAILCQNGHYQQSDQIIRESTGMLIWAPSLSRQSCPAIITISEKYAKKLFSTAIRWKQMSKSAKAWLSENGQRYSISIDDVDSYPRNRVVAVVTGAQVRAMPFDENSQWRPQIYPYPEEWHYSFLIFVIPATRRMFNSERPALPQRSQVLNYQMLDVHAGDMQQRRPSKNDPADEAEILFPIHGQYSMMVNHGMMLKLRHSSGKYNHRR